MQLTELPGQDVWPDRATREVLDGVSAIVRAVRCAEHRPSWPDATLRRADATVLRVLAVAGELRTGDLAHKLTVDASVVSRQLASLVAEGLVERHPDPSDARVSLARLTPKGRDKLTALHAAYADRLHEALGDWSEQDLLAAAAALKRLAAAIAPPATN